MSIVVLIHGEDTGPGNLSEYRKKANADIKFIELYRGDPLPEYHANVAGVISLGGIMNVYQDKEYPFLGKETEFLQSVIHKNIPVLGICLGAQLIARASGARVSKMPAMELGWTRVKLTANGLADPLFLGVPPDLTVFEWHEDSFAIPEGAALLATSPVCANQAFRYRNAWGVQFHPEVTRRIVSEWCDNDGITQDRKNELLSGFDLRKEGFQSLAIKLWANFNALVESLGRSNFL